MMLSSSADTALGDVLTVQSTPTVGIPSMEQQGFLSFMRSPQAGADSTSRLSQTEEANAGMLARSAARSGLIATWHAHLASDICLLFSLKVQCMQ